MNNIINLTTVLLKNSVSGFGTSKSSGLKNKIIFLLIFISFLPLITGIVKLTKTLYISLPGNTSIILTISSAIYCMLIFLLGFFFIISVFYFSQDIDFILPLPVKPSEILSAKFFTVLIYEYCSGLLFFAPVIITYGVLSNSNVIFYVYFIVVFLTLPVIPLAAVSLITILVMSFIPFSKNKDIFRTAAGVFAIIIGLGLSIYVQTYFKGISESQMIQTMILHNNQKLIKYFSSLFPPVKFSTYALFFYDKMEGLYNLIIFSIINIISFILVVSAGGKYYLKGALSGGSNSSTRIRLLNYESRDRTALYALTKREIVILFRTPSYFLNCVLINFIWPFLIILFSLQNPDSFENITSYLKSRFSLNCFIYSGISLGILLSSINAIASTTFSREGKDLFYLKILPFSPEILLKSKIVVAFSLSFIGLLFVIPMIAIYKIAEFPSLLIIFVASSAGIYFSTIAGIIIDLYSPKLTWDNEYKAVKQNLNSIISMVLQFAVIALFIFLIQNNFYNNTFLPIVLLVAFFAGIFITYLYAKRKIGFLLSRIE